MKRVTGIGGIFFKSDDPERLYQWYETHLGIRRSPDGTGVAFEWREANGTEGNGMTVWSVFPRSTTYFDPSRSGFMINYRVPDLDGLLEALKAEGVQIAIRTAKTTTMAASPGSWIQTEIALSYGSRRSNRALTFKIGPRTGSAREPFGACGTHSEECTRHWQ